jgi:hypothetical protein
MALMRWAGVLAGGLALALGSASLGYRAGVGAVCQQGDASAGLPAAGVRMLETEAAWAKQAVACKVGDLLVMVPANGADTFRAFISRRGRPFMIADGASMRLLDETGARIVFQEQRNAGDRDRVSYSVVVGPERAVVENVDNDADGTLDLRFTDTPGVPRRTEFRIGERWLELVTREGKQGAVVDGEFMSADEARARLQKR